MKNFLFAFVLLLLCSRADAQLPGMRKYTQFDGLTGTNCYGLDQDRNGYLWIGTDNGGMCFDGKKFSSLQQAGSMPDADILGCSPVGDDRILLIPVTGSVRIFDKGRLLPVAEVPALKGTEHSDHNICKRDPLTGAYWLVNDRSKEIYAFRGKDIRMYRMDRTFYIPYAYGGRLLCIDQDENLSIYNPVNNQFQVLYLPNGQKIHNDERKGLTNQESFNGYITILNHVSHVLEIYRYIPGDSVVQFVRNFSLPADGGIAHYALVDHNREVWLKFRGEGGIVYLGSIDPGAAAQPIRFMQFGGINSLFVDRSDNIWMSSQNNALYFFSRRHFINLLRTVRLNLRQEMPYSLSGDGKGNILIGYSNSAQLVYVHANGHRIFRLNEHFREGVRKILPLDDSHYILCGNDIALFNTGNGKIERQGFIAVTSKDVCRYGRHGLLFSHTGGVDYCRSIQSRWSNRGEVFKGRSTAVATLPDLSILVGTPRGLYFKRGLDDVARKVNDPILGESNITSLLVLPDTSVLAGTNAHGLHRYEPDGRTTAIRNREGQPQHIRSLYLQNDSIYWVASDEGAWRLVFRGGALADMKNYTFYDGLPSNNVNSIYVYRDTAYVATADGMGVVFPDDSLQQMPAPAVYLNSVQADQTVFRRPEQMISLAHNQNNLLVSLSAISHESFGNVRFYYRLYPYQTQWIHTADPDIRFTRLPPGDYVLEAYALNAKGVRSKQSIALEVHISPAFWQTWYFRTGAAVQAALLLLLLLRQWILRREQGKIEKIQQKKRLAELELEAIKAQINPHFIYNCLNSIQYLNYKSEHLQAQHYLDLFARLIRMTMQYSQQAFLSLAEEKEYLSRYLQLEQLRFKEKLRYDIQVTGNIPESTLLPAMLVQPYVENALKHGIAGREDGHISICFEKQNDHLLVTVADNGSGFSTLSRQGALGMRLSGTRALSYNKLFNLSIRIDRHNRQDRDPGTEGAVVQITIPPISYGNILQSDHHR